MSDTSGVTASIPLVTAIIPTHNRASLVVRAVRSVLRQTHTAIEAVVVDDGSTDGTQARLAGLDDPRLRVLTHEQCRGVSAARNTGLGAARGAYVALLDSDDVWLPRKTERQLAFMQARGLVISQTQEIWMRGGRRVNPCHVHRKPDGFFFKEALARCLVSPSTVMGSRGYWEECGGFDESLAACEDYDLWLRTLVRHPIGLLDALLAVRHGGRPDQLSAIYIGQDLFRIRAMLKLLGQEGLTLWHKECMARELRHKALLYARGCLKRDRPDEAQRVLGLVETALGNAGMRRRETA